jgi:hypothetical protein
LLDLSCPPCMVSRPCRRAPFSTKVWPLSVERHADSFRRASPDSLSTWKKIRVSVVNPTRMVNEMPQENAPRRVKSNQQMILALELRASGASYMQIGKALSVSKTRAFRIVRAGLDELVVNCRETAERVKQMELYRLDRLRLALDSRKSDPRVADTLIRISERVAKLHGLDAPQRIEASGPNGGPIETEEKIDFSRLTFEEKLQLEELHRKALGLPEPCIDEGPYSRKWYAAQRTAETQSPTFQGTEIRMAGVNSG